jgi:hypothetical protein
MVVTLVVLIPVAVLISAGFGAAILGWLLKSDADEAYEGTEYLDLG